MESITYEEISSMEAMSLIDQNKINNLYFVEIYYESEIPYGNNGNFVKCMVPNEVKQTEPIRYKSSMIIKTDKLLFPFKEIEAKPGEIIRKTSCVIPKGHRWVIKKERLDVKPKPPVFKPIRK